MTTAPASDELIAEIERSVTKCEPVCITGQIQALIARIRKEQEDKAVMARALRKLLNAVCGETGFASAVRANTGHAYPWPALDIAEEEARAALTGSPTIISDMEAEIERLKAELSREKERSVGDWANQRDNDHLTIKYHELKASSDAEIERLRAKVQRLEAETRYRTGWVCK